MQRRTFFTTLIGAGVVAAYKPAAATRQQRSPAKSKLDLDTLLAVTEVPGIAVAGIINGKPIQIFAGVSSATNRVPVTADTYFPAASLSKPVFAWAVREM